jgi:hypothetical protein
MILLFLWDISDWNETALAIIPNLASGNVTGMDFGGAVISYRAVFDIPHIVWVAYVVPFGGGKNRHFAFTINIDKIVAFHVNLL